MAWKEISRKKCTKCNGTGQIDAKIGIGEQTTKRNCGCESGYIIKRVEICVHCRGINSDCAWCRGTGIQKKSPVVDASPDCTDGDKEGGELPVEDGLETVECPTCAGNTWDLDRDWNKQDELEQEIEALEQVLAA